MTLTRMLFLLALVACEPAPPEVAATPESSPAPLDTAAPDCEPAPPEVAAEPETLPSPFDADALAWALPVGTVIEFVRFYSSGKEFFDQWEIVEANDREVVIRTTALFYPIPGFDGPHPFEDETYTWEELESGGRFPAASTVVRETVIKTPIGTLPVRVYIVDGHAETNKSSSYYFSPAFPGTWVRVDHEMDGEILESTQVIRVTTPRESY